MRSTMPSLDSIMKRLAHRSSVHQYISAFVTKHEIQRLNKLTSLSIEHAKSLSDVIKAMHGPS
eukprot:7364970-Karenia_brevis.AAC.1